MASWHVTVIENSTGFAAGELTCLQQLSAKLLIPHVNFQFLLRRRRCATCQHIRVHTFLCLLCRGARFAQGVEDDDAADGEADDRSQSGHQQNREAEMEHIGDYRHDGGDYSQRVEP